MRVWKCENVKMWKCESESVAECECLGVWECENVENVLKVENDKKSWKC